MTDRAPRVAAHTLAAVIPVLDEAYAIGQLVEGLLANGACCVYAVDGGSRDGTPNKAAASGAIVLAEPRRGYGRACLTGAGAALDSGHAAVCFLDGDGSCDPADLPVLATALRRADVVLGRRTTQGIEPRALPWHARAGNAIVARLVSLRAHRLHGSARQVHDLPPFKLFRASALARLALDDEGYGWTVQSVARSLTCTDLHVVERPVRFRRRQGGRSKVSGSLRASIHAGRAMLAVAWRETAAPPVLALMAKAPRDGHAKTRLAADIGAERTRALWTACLLDGGRSLAGVARSTYMHPVVVVPTTEDAGQLGSLLGTDWSVLIQERERLAGALVDAFLFAFDRGAGLALAVGADSPTLPARLVIAAQKVLRGDIDAVLGPCPDGGYYLIGVRFRRRLPLVGPIQRRRLTGRLERALARVPMGEGKALESTRTALVEGGWRVALLDPWLDLDVGRDLAGLAASVHEDPLRFARMTAWLAEHERVVREWSIEEARTSAPGRADSLAR